MLKITLFDIESKSRSVVLKFTSSKSSLFFTFSQLQMSEERVNRRLASKRAFRFQHYSMRHKKNFRQLEERGQLTCG